MGYIRVVGVCMLYAGFGMVSGLLGKLCIGNLIRLVIIVDVGSSNGYCRGPGQVVWAEVPEFLSSL